MLEPHHKEKARRAALVAADVVDKTGELMQDVASRAQRRLGSPRRVGKPGSVPDDAAHEAEVVKTVETVVGTDDRDSPEAPFFIMDGFTRVLLVALLLSVGVFVVQKLPVDVAKSSTYSQGFSAGQKEAEQRFNADDGIYSHCSFVGSDVASGDFYYDGATGTCYQGSEINKHLAKLQADAKLAKKQLNAASFALGQLSSKRHASNDIVWRSLAIEFAATSNLPQAYKAGENAYLEHGGSSINFDYSVSLAKSKMRTPDRLPLPLDRETITISGMVYDVTDCYQEINGIRNYGLGYCASGTRG